MFQTVSPTDHPSNREPVRPTVRPDLLRRKTNIVSAASTFTLFIATTEVAAFGRATSFVVSFVVAMKRVDVVAADTIFVLRLSKSGRTVLIAQCLSFGHYVCTDLALNCIITKT